MKTRTNVVVLLLCSLTVLSYAQEIWGQTGRFHFRKHSVWHWFA